MLLVVLLAGCTSSRAPESASEDSSLAPLAAAASQQSRRPTDVATSYLRAIVSGDFEEAATWVKRDQRGIVEALGLGRGPGTMPHLSGQVSAGSLKSTGEGPEGQTAAVTFIGEMCRTPAETAEHPAPKTECVRNDDAEVGPPYFTVDLVDTPTEGWRVVFATPTAQER
jgi:hypothetical protein